MKYLALCREGSEIVAAKHVVEAIQPIVVGDSNIVEVKNPKIVAVYKLESFKACVRCQSLIEPGSPPLCEVH